MSDPVATTIASYEAKSDEYIRNTDQLSYFPDLPDMLDKFISLLPGKRVLDVAFGSGRDTIYLSTHGISTEGIELTQAFIDSLHGKAITPLYKMDMRWLGFADSVFDGIWCCAAFLHVPRSQAIMTLSGFARALKSHGVLYFDLKEGSGDEWKSEGNVNEARRFFTYYTLGEITQMLVDSNFEILFTRRQEHAKKNSNKPLWLNLMCRKSS